LYSFAECRKRLGEEHYAKDGLSEFSKAARRKKSLIYRIALTVGKYEDDSRETKTPKRVLPMAELAIL
jgi:hypothetical protein